MSPKQSSAENQYIIQSTTSSSHGIQQAGFSEIHTLQTPIVQTCMLSPRYTPQTPTTQNINHHITDIYNILDILALTLLSRQTLRLLTWASPHGIYTWQPGCYLPAPPSQGRDLKPTPEPSTVWSIRSFLLRAIQLVGQVFKVNLDQISLGL